LELITANVRLSRKKAPAKTIMVKYKTTIGEVTCSTYT
jgi:hypothetical protein